MVRRESTHSTALKVRVAFEPHHGTPDCVAHAYERIVPVPRRTVAPNAPAALREAGHTQRVGRRKLTFLFLAFSLY
jgi:hypothetical protein